MSVVACFAAKLRIDRDVAVERGSAGKSPFVVMPYWRARSLFEGALGFRLVLRL